jgi:hypothetical protein
MPTNDYLPFGTGPGANVISQASFLSLAQRPSGFQSGIAQSAQLNKVWRQSSVVAAMIAQFTADNTNQNIIDDGNIPNLEALFKLAIQAVNRTKLSADLNIYVSPSGNASNTGLSPSSPLLSINQALSLGYRNYDYNGNFLRINLAPGVYNESVGIQGLPVGCPSIFMSGNNSNPQGTIINAVNSNSINLFGTFVQLNGFQVGASGATVGLIGNGIGIVANQSYAILDHISFGSCGVAQLAVYNQSVVAPGGSPLFFSGTSGYGVYTSVSSYFWAPNTNITFAGGTVYSNYFVVASFNSVVTMYQIGGGSQFTGSFTGARFAANLNSSMNLNGGGINYIPGTLPGFVDSSTFGVLI